MAQPFQTYGGPPYHSAPYYPQYQQYGGSQASPPGFPQQMTPQMSGYQASPGMNIARFDGNQPPPHPPPAFPFGGPPPPNPELLKHFASSVPPPPPPHFPPVPLPNMGFPQFSQNSTPVPHTPIHQNLNHSARPPTDVDSYDPRYPQHVPQNMPQKMAQPPRFVAAPAPNYQSRGQADGFEQRDGPEFLKNQSRPFHQHNVSQANRGAFEGNRYPSVVDGSLFSTQQHYHTRTFQPPAIHAPQPIHTNISDTLERQTQHMNERQPVTPASKPISPKDTPTRTETSTHNSPSPMQGQMCTSKPPQKQHTGKSVADLKGLAKGAIMSLLQKGIQYDALVKEGVNEKVLRELYSELSISVGETPATKNVVVGSEIPKDKPPSVSAANDTSSEGVAKDVPIISGDSATVASVNITVAPAAPPVMNPLILMKAASPSLERKDRIAQLLAAKAGRPSPSRSVSGSIASPGPADVQHSSELPLPSKVDASALSDEVPSSREAQLQAPQPQSQDTNIATTSNDQNDTRTTVSSIPKIEIPARDTVLSSPLLSAIPGLFMSSKDISHTGQNPQPDAVAASFKLDNRTSQKRSHDEVSQNTSDEPLLKRPNTTSLTAGDSAMLDENSEVLPASAASTVEDLKPTSDIQAATDALEAVKSSRQPETKSGTRLTEKEFAEKASMLKARFLKQRAERQKALQDGLPDLNAEVQKSRSRLQQQQTRLAQLRSRIAHLGHDLSEARNEERTTLEEIQRLERQVQEGVSGQKQYNDELRNLSNSNESAKLSATTTGTAVSTHGTEAAAEPVANGQYSSEDEGQVTSEHQSTGQTTRSPSETGEIDGSSVEQPSTAAYASSRDDIQMNDDKVVVDASEDPDRIDAAQSDQHTAQDASIEASQNPSTALLEIQSAGGADTMDSERTPADSQMDEDADSDGSASMSDSGSDVDEEDDYEPVANAINGPLEAADHDDSDEYDPEAVQVDDTPSQTNREEVADYEPTDVIARPESPASQKSEAMLASPASNAEQAEVQLKDVLDVVKSLKPSADPTPVSLPDTPKFGAPSEHSQSRLSTDLKLPGWSRTSGAVRPLSNDGNGLAGFTPYQSPLSAFSSFRYNSTFNDSIKDGFRSLTYSNSINPAVPLCQTELQGGECQDAQCEDQHFRHLGLSDDKILVQMSSALDIQEPDTRNRYLKGLKQVIADLRQGGVKEFENVANALSTYRRKFFTEQLT